LSGAQDQQNQSDNASRRQARPARVNKTDGLDEDIASAASSEPGLGEGLALAASRDRVIAARRRGSGVAANHPPMPGIRDLC
jgi:hypothetical protein